MATIPSNTCRTIATACMPGYRFDARPATPLFQKKKMTEFEGTVPALAQAFRNRGYTNLTPVQTAVLDSGLRDADTLVSAQTGSGKTVAFGMSIAPTMMGDADRFAAANAPLGLIITPTRELALQVKRELEWLYELTGAAFASCVGGMDMRTERRALQRGAHIVVGTPGRLRDHIERGSFDTSGLKAVVLDEADEMLDLGFRDDLEHILDAAPKDRRTLMFSATVPRSIESLAKQYQHDAVRVATTSEQKQHVDIEYRALSVAPNDEENAIVNVLRYYDAKNALVFCATRAAVNRLTSRFNNRGFSVVALSGELTQNERTHALQAMRDGRARVCVATDVAARGIDLPNLELVIHAEIPKTAETLLHRSGRTGRAGRKGVCTLIVPHNWKSRTQRLLQRAKIDATWAAPPSAEDVMGRDQERLLSDPSLTDPLTDFERAFVQDLLSRHSAEHVAAAFVRKHFAEQAAPEELMDVASAAHAPKHRDDFKDGVWLSLSVGRKDAAEPRWLLPMLCRAGHITKRDIGAIRVQLDETFVELAPNCVDQFFDALGPEAILENNIAVVRLDGMPAIAKGGRRDDPRPPRPQKTRRDSTDRPRRRNDQEPRVDVKPLSTNKRQAPDGSKPKRKPSSKSDERADTQKPRKKSPKKAKSKSFVPNRHKSGGKKEASDRSGMAPLKRKKSKKT